MNFDKNRRVTSVAKKKNKQKKQKKNNLEKK